MRFSMKITQISTSVPNYGCLYTFTVDNFRYSQKSEYKILFPVGGLSQDSESRQFAGRQTEPQEVVSP